MDRVKRRAYIIGTLAVLLTVQTIQSTGAYSKVVNFQRYYRDLQQGQNSLSPIERIVFSLVLSNSKTDPPKETPVGRT